MRTTLLAVIAASLLGACVASVHPAGPPGEPPPPPPRGHEPHLVEGVVTDAMTHRPIDRAGVDITSPAFQGEMTVVTGPDGRFRTQEIPRGEFAIRCRREGYEPYNGRGSMNEGISHIDCELRPKH